MNRKNLTLVGKMSNRTLREDNDTLRKKLSFLVHANKLNYETQLKLNRIGENVLTASSMSGLIKEVTGGVMAEFDVSAVSFTFDDGLKPLFASYTPLDGDKGMVTERLFFMKQSGIAALFETEGKVRLRGNLEHGSVDLFGLKFYRRVRSEAVVPLMYGGKYLGSLNLGSRDEKKYRPGVMTDFLLSLAQTLSLAVANIELRERVLKG